MLWHLTLARSLMSNSETIKQKYCARCAINMYTQTSAATGQFASWVCVTGLRHLLWWELKPVQCDLSCRSPIHLVRFWGQWWGAMWVLSLYQAALHLTFWLKGSCAIVRIERYRMLGEAFASHGNRARFSGFTTDLWFTTLFFNHGFRSVYSTYNISPPKKSLYVKYS